MNVRLKAKAKVAGEWKEPGDVVELPDKEARRLIDIGVAEAAGDAPTDKQPSETELEAMKAELARLQEFERQQLAAAEAQTQKDEAERKPADEAVTKGRGKAAAKDDADGQTSGK